MLISIVTPTLALDEVLSEARASVKRQYAHVTIEHIIVVDDPDAVLPPGSQSGNVFTYFSYNTQKKGPGGARNTALERVKGDFVFFLDADDIWDDDYLSDVLPVYAARPDVHCVSVAGLTFGKHVLRPRLNIPLLAEGIIPRSGVAWNPVGCPSGFSYRLDGKTKALRFKDAIYFQDLIFYLELLSTGAVFWRHSKSYFWYRKSEGQLTSVVSADKVRMSERMVHHCLAEWRDMGISPREARIASIQIRRLSAARLRRRDHASTLLLCLLAPNWAFGQVRRLMENARIDRDATPPGRASCRSAQIAP